MCNESASLFFSLQTSDDDERVKLKKKKKKSKRRLSSNVESGVDAKSRKERKSRSKKKHSKRREHEFDREDGEISEEDDCSDQLRSEKGKRRRRRADADGRPSKIPTIEIPDSTESSIDSDRSFSNVKLHGNWGYDAEIRARFIAHIYNFIGWQKNPLDLP